MKSSHDRPAPHHRRWLAALLCSMLWACLAAWVHPGTVRAAVTIELQPVTSGLNQPVAITHAGDASGRMFITQKGGQIVIFDGTALLPTPFLDISAIVTTANEQGLLSVAFDPDYAVNGFFYVNFTNLAGNTVIARYSVSADPDVADPDSAIPLLTILQPFDNHNGGQLQFGPDGFLYIGMGDGGSGGDPNNNAQNPNVLLGKMLRIDVTGSMPYAVPPDNPFVGMAGERPEIWATGLRNPWRFSFDRDTGDLFIADVGQDSAEEVNFQPATSSGGENYGWRRMEGSQCFNPSFGCDNGLLTLPVLEYDHAAGCSVTGGYRYRGLLFPGLTGLYFFADYCTGIVWGAQDDETGDWTGHQLTDTNLMISTFGEDEDGEIYLAHLAAAPNGAIYRLSTQVPGTPGDLRATVAAPSQIDLNWTDNASGEDGFRVVRKIGSQGVYVQVATLAADTIAYQDTGLAPGNTFHYRVLAFNAFGDSAFSTPASAVLPSDGSGGCFIAIIKDSNTKRY